MSVVEWLVELGGVASRHALSGVLSHTSAALHWGREVKSVPDQPHVTVPAKRKLSPSALRRIAATVQGPGAPRVRRVCGEASALAANPLESVLRAIALDVPGLCAQPQHWIGPRTRPDLVDEDLGIVIEADSFAWHGSRAALRRDAQRYNEMVRDGWIVLRLTWEDVMLGPERVRAVLTDVVALAQRRGEVLPRAGASA